MASGLTEEQREKKRAYDLAYYRKHRAHIIASVQSKYRSNPEPKRQYGKNYYRTNKSVIIGRYYANQKSHLARSRAWKQNNRARHAAHSRKYHKTHPVEHIVLCQKRRALKKAATVNLRHIKEWMAGIKSRQKARCYYCQKQIQIESVHFDHIIPLSKGGQHSVENLCVSCVRCNLSKRDKFVRAWIKIGQQMLEI